MGGSWKLSIEYVVPDDKLFGSQLANGSWTGLMGLLTRGEVDMTGTVMSQSEERFLAIDFSTPLYMDESKLICKRPIFQSDITGFLKPFTVMTWMVLMVTVVVVTAATASVLQGRSNLFKDSTFLNSPRVELIARNVVGIGYFVRMILTLPHTTECSSQCEVCSSQCEVCSSQCEVCSSQCEVCSSPCKMCSSQCKVCSSQCEVCSSQCKVCSSQCKVCSSQCKVCSSQCKMCSSQCKMCSSQCKVCSCQCKVCSSQCKVCSSQCEVCSSQCKVCSSQCKVCSSQCKVCSSQCKMCSSQCKVYSSQCKVCSSQCKVCSSQCKVCSSQCKMCSSQCKVCSSQCKVCSSQCKVCSSQCKVCSSQCEVCSSQCEVCSSPCKVCSSQCKVCSSQCKGDFTNLATLFFPAFERLPRGDSVRVVVGIWLLLTLIVGTVYRSNLNAMLALPKLHLPFNNLEELVDKGIPCFINRGTMVHQFIEAKPGSTLYRFKKQAVIHSDVPRAIRDVLQHNHAAFGTMSGILYIIHNTFAMTKTCPYYLAKETYYASTSVSLAFPKNSTLRHKIDPLIQRLQEFGILNYQLMKGLQHARNCLKSDTSTSATFTLRPLELGDFYGALCIYSGGLLLACLTFILELINKRRRPALLA
nr:uncharacterized protein LOC123763353 [Procambarus clarkii]